MRLALPATLAAACLALLGAIVYEAAAPLPPVAVEIPRLPARRGGAAPPPVYAPPSEALFADIDAHPLFAANRKPLADSTQAGAALTASSDFALAGIIMGGDRAVALLRIKSANSTSSAVLGDLVSGWRVVRIDARTVTLHANGADVVIPLAGPDSQPPSAPLPALDQSALPAPAAPNPPPAAAAPALSATTAPAKPTVPSPPAVATTAPAQPAHKPYIAPEALKGAYIDPVTGEPSL
ncbi:MAG: hypothetical protein WDN03_09635 [Rhizomicrobium sp.]